MDIKELRVGNFVTIDNPKHPFLLGVTVTIVGIQSDGRADSVRIGHVADNTMGQLLKFVNPVPITPEILAAFGFRDIFEVLEDTPPQWVIESDDIYITQKENGYFATVGKREILMDSVHQLQNLYFALTGEELEYKPAN